MQFVWQRASFCCPERMNETCVAPTETGVPCPFRGGPPEVQRATCILLDAFHVLDAFFAEKIA